MAKSLAPTPPDALQQDFQEQITCIVWDRCDRELQRREREEAARAAAEATR